MRLLVVEDEKSLRDDITKKLRLDGYEADACGDGNEAVSCLPLSVTTWSCLISTCPARTE